MEVDTEMRAWVSWSLLARSVRKMWPFALFWFLFNFNGFQVLKLEAGHVQNAAYLLIPGFLYLLKRVC